MTEEWVEEWVEDDLGWTLIITSRKQPWFWKILSFCGILLSIGVGFLLVTITVEANMNPDLYDLPFPPLSLLVVSLLYFFFIMYSFWCYYQLKKHFRRKSGGYNNRINNSKFKPL